MYLCVGTVNTQTHTFLLTVTMDSMLSAHLGGCNRIPHGWLQKKEIYVVTFMEVKYSKSRCQNGWFLVKDLFLASRWPSPLRVLICCGQWGRHKLSGVTPHEGINPMVRCPLSWPHLNLSPISISHTLGVRVSTYKLERDTIKFIVHVVLNLTFLIKITTLIYIMPFIGHLSIQVIFVSKLL